MTRTLTVPLENTPGSLSTVCRLLGKEKINIEAFEVGGIGEMGFARLVTSNPEKAEKVLRSQGFPVTSTETLEATLPNRPGELARICDALTDAGVNIESAYGTNPTAGDGRIVFRVDNVEEAKKAFQKATPKVVLARA